MRSDRRNVKGIKIVLASDPAFLNTVVLKLVLKEIFAQNEKIRLLIFHHKPYDIIMSLSYIHMSF